MASRSTTIFPAGMVTFILARYAIYSRYDSARLEEPRNGVEWGSEWRPFLDYLHLLACMSFRQVAVMRGSRPAESILPFAQQPLLPNPPPFRYG